MSDAFATEQTELLRRYYLGKSHETSSRWSADGEHSISPFVPCAEGRIPYVLRACRLAPGDVLWVSKRGFNHCCAPLWLGADWLN